MSGEIKPKIAEYTPIKPKFELYLFSGVLGDKKIIFQVIKMTNSIMIFVNYLTSRQLNDLSLAMNSKHERQPLATQLLGDFSDLNSKQIVAKLSKKLRKIVFLSCNVATDRITVAYISERITEEININPNKF